MSSDIDLPVSPGIAHTGWVGSSSMGLLVNSVLYFFHEGGIVGSSCITLKILKKEALRYVEYFWKPF